MLKKLFIIALLATSIVSMQGMEPALTTEQANEIIQQTLDEADNAQAEAIVQSIFNSIDRLRKDVVFTDINNLGSLFFEKFQYSEVFQPGPVDINNSPYGADDINNELKRLQIFKKGWDKAKKRNQLVLFVQQELPDFVSQIYWNHLNYSNPYKKRPSLLAWQMYESQIRRRLDDTMLNTLITHYEKIKYLLRIFVWLRFNTEFFSRKVNAARARTDSPFLLQIIKIVQDYHKQPISSWFDEDSDSDVDDYYVDIEEYKKYGESLRNIFDIAKLFPEYKQYLKTHTKAQRKKKRSNQKPLEPRKKRRL